MQRENFGHYYATVSWRVISFVAKFPYKYIVDFICQEEKLIIEVDGGQHMENKEADDLRTAWLELRGYRVLRFWNDQVLNETETVWDEILRILKKEI